MHFFKKITKILSDYRIEIMAYLLTRIFLMATLSLFFSSGVFLEDINVIFYYATHPFSLITGSFAGGVETAFGAYSPLQPLFYFPFTLSGLGLDSIRLATFVFEFLTFLLMILMVDRHAKKGFAHKAAWLFVFVPLTWVMSIVWAQDETLAALFLLIIVYFKLEKKDDLAALFLGLACIASKIVPFIIFIPLLLTAKNKKRTSLLALLPILIIYIPVQLNYKLLGIGSPVLEHLSIVTLEHGSLSVVHPLKLIFGSMVNWNYISLVLMATSFIAYYFYLFRKYRKNEIPDFIDMALVCFFIYFIFFYAMISPAHYIFIVALLLLRLAMIEKINTREALILLLLSASSISWKVVHLISVASKNPGFQEFGVLNTLSRMHAGLVGTQFLAVEELALIFITLSVIFNYLLFFLCRYSKEFLEKTQDALVPGNPVGNA